MYKCQPPGESGAWTPPVPAVPAPLVATVWARLAARETSSGGAEFLARPWRRAGSAYCAGGTSRDRATARSSARCRTSAAGSLGGRGLLPDELGEIDLAGDGHAGLGLLDEIEIRGQEPRVEAVHGPDAFGAG
jgi:hypothetical protein